MVKRKERNIEELYNATGVVREPEITPVLRGSCHMQGPVDEIEQDIEENMLSPESEKRFGRHSMNRKVRMSAESGTCNVCSAPCSSCMHRNLSLMGSKGEEFSDETCRITAASQYSISGGDDLRPFKGRACDTLQQTTSEASNLLSVNSSHDSFSENAESKATVRFSDISDASDNMDVLPKLSSGGSRVEDQLSSKPQCNADQRTFSNKYEESKDVEGHDDNISCVSRANEPGMVVSYDNRNLDLKNVSCSSASVSSIGSEGSGKASFSHRLGMVEIPSNGLDVEGKLPECRIEHTNVSHIGKRSPAYKSANNFPNSKISLDGGLSEVSNHICPKLEAETDKDSGNLPDEGIECLKQGKQDEKFKESVELPEMQGPPLQSVSGDESDESEIVEHDVKVCDICGDAGREDLLAICSRCSDGAEHTYCMREMLQKVPEGDWLCEECKFAEENENQKQVSDAEGKVTNKVSSIMQNSGKRPAENTEVSPVSKRQAIDTNIGSPKSLSPSRTAVLSRDSSFKSLDKGKVKPAHQTSANQFSNDILETARSPTTGPRLQTPKGTLLKSNSFSTLNSKPKVKLVDEVPQKLKGAREHASLEIKEPGRMMSKSMSFQATSSSHSSASESKVKMLSSKIAHVQDLKGLKQLKERHAFERKNLSKLDRPPASSMAASSIVSTPKVDQKLTPRVESNRESKATQHDGKLSTLSKSTSNLSRKTLEIPVTSVVTSSTNGMSSASAEQKINQVSPKDEPSSSSSWTADRPTHSVNGNQQDGLPRSRESSIHSEKTRESFGNRLRPTGTTGSKNLPCKKCKEVGHATEACTVGGQSAADIDVSAVKSIRGETNKGSKLKAAIEAAMLKKPGIYRKKRESEQSGGLSTSNVDVNCEVASQDLLSASNKLQSGNSAVGTKEAQASLWNYSSDSYKQTTLNDVKQLDVHSTDADLPSKVGDSDPTVPSVGKPLMRGLSSIASTAAPVLSKTPAIPEHEYIWQGAFEVNRGGKLPDLHGGIQAHLSSCASPKVLEVVNKFTHKMWLDEVPRLSMWPAQFHENGAKEDNVALYFFAKDLESYERNYRGLLESMIKNDLALKGTFDGVELLIFPSNQLPENSQRWNMLFFLWGVFKGRRVNHSDSLKKLDVPSLNVVPLDMDVPPSVKSLSENLCLPGQMDKNWTAHNSSCSVGIASVAPDKVYTSIDGDHKNNKASNDHTSLSKQIKLEQNDSRFDSESLAKIATSNTQLCPEDEIRFPECGLVTKLKASPQLTNNGSNNDDKKQNHWDAPPIKGNASSFRTHGSQDTGVVQSVDVEKVSDGRNSYVNEIKIESTLKEDGEEADVEAALGRNMSVKVENCWQSNPRKRSLLDLTETTCQSSTGTSQKMLWNEVNSLLVDEGSVSKKLKTGLSGMYGSSSSRDSSSLSDGFASQTHDQGPSSSTEEKRCDKDCDKKPVLEDLGTTERHFFPVDSHYVNNVRLGDNSMPWKEHSSGEEDRVCDGVPNLELALGAETKPPNKGILPFFFGMVDKNNNQNKHLNKVTDEEGEDDVSASLSLSLSFPFPEKEQTVKPVSKTEQLLPERRHVNTSLLLFQGFPDK